jgi:DNA (cytosine-5)-methyltransferase 1
MEQMTNVDTPSTLTHVSLCAGYGGIDLGLKRAIPALRTIAFAEIEAFACANLVAKMEAGLLDPAPLWTDLKTFPWSDFHDCVDILSGGYPCQPFSAAGKRLGADDPRHLWPYISAGIAAMRPSLCFFENVEGHITLGLPDVIEDLAGLGYRTTWGIFSASEVGAVHQRKRVFILAECSSQRSAARFSRSLAGQEGIAGIANNCSGEAGSELEHARVSSADAFAPQCWSGDISRQGTACQSSHGTAWPARPGQQQYEWEPPRVVGNAEAAGRRQDIGSVAAPRQGEQEERQQWRPASSNFVDPDSAMDDAKSMRSRETADGGEESSWQIESPLGGDPHGPVGGVGYAELCVTSDNRTDELRLLGNGVVPATAERAFRVLFAELT